MGYRYGTVLPAVGMPFRTGYVRYRLPLMDCFLFARKRFACNIRKIGTAVVQQYAPPDRTLGRGPRLDFSLESTD